MSTTPATNTNITMSPSTPVDIHPATSLNTTTHKTNNDDASSNTTNQDHPSQPSSPPTSTQTPSAYLENAKHAINLLNQDLQSLDQTSSSEARIAKQAVSLLSRMSSIYWDCAATRPSWTEMKKHVEFARACVEEALKMRGDQQKQAEKMQNGSGDQVMMSQGTMERQLGYQYHPFSRDGRGGYNGPVKYPTMRGSSSWYVPRYGNGGRHWTPNRYLYARQAPFASSKIPSGPAAYRARRNGFVPQYYEPVPFTAPDNKEGSHGSEEEEDNVSIITDPFRDDDLTTTSSDSSGGVLLPDVDIEEGFEDEASEEKEKEKPVVMTYLDGRDHWACDFCGPECFCWELEG